MAFGLHLAYAWCSSWCFTLLGAGCAVGYADLWPPPLGEWLPAPQQWAPRILSQQEPLLASRLPPSPHQLVAHHHWISLLHWKTPTSLLWPPCSPQDLPLNLVLINPHPLWILPQPLPHHWGASTTVVPSPSIWWQTTLRTLQTMWRLQLLQEGLSAPQFESKRQLS